MRIDRRHDDSIAVHEIQYWSGLGAVPVSKELKY
jgi:hypothetical protein